MNDPAQTYAKVRLDAELKLARMPHGMKMPKLLPTDQIIHELQVHQIELEMQNEELRRAQVELEKSRDHYVEFFDFSPVGYITLSDKELILEINLTGAALLRVERSVLLNRSFTSFLNSVSVANWHRHFRNVLANGGTHTCEWELLRGDGTSFFAQLDSLCLKKNDGETTVRIVLTDITQRRLAEAEMYAQKEFFHMIAENVEDFIAVLDLEGRRLYNSPSFGRIFGDIESLKGTDSFAEIHPDDRERVKKTFKETIKSGVGLHTEFRFLLQNGDIHYMESCGGLIKDNNGKPLRVVVVSRDITDRKQAEIQIHNLAFHDSLTQLPNRRLLVDRLEQAIASSKRNGQYCAAMFLDLDNFKLLNDNHGHKAGDLLLIEVARRLLLCVREVDTVARLGGDEFVVVLCDLGEEISKCDAEANIVAEKIRSALDEPYWLNYSSKGTSKMILHHCTVSIGVVSFRSPTSEDNILRWADRAMYQAKEAGRNRIQFHSAAVE